MSTSHFNTIRYLSLIALSAALLASGCSSRQTAQAPQAVEVKAMQVIQQDTPVTYEYVGQVKAKNEVQIKAKVSGNIVAKMVEGGARVSEGQPLFQIDRRQYEAALLNARATLAQAEAALNNSRRDTLRYQQLAAKNGIAQQTLDAQLAAEQQNAAAVDAYQAKARQAADDLDDTLIVAPFNGRIDVNDLSVGDYVTAGSTTLAAISSVNPVFIQFSMSENEYLQLAQHSSGTEPREWGGSLKLILSNGAKYPLAGRIAQVDKGLNTDTGTLTLKAVFDNPQQLLIPGMFARIVAEGEMRRGALLVPQRAVQQILGKTFVTVVAAGNKAESRPVQMGPRVGSLWVAEEGLTAGDQVIVEGFSKVQAGTPLQVVMVAPDDLATAEEQ
ncbi:efflux RND transporter periplasmic adaptor subunit [Acetonema longum]|uniref:Efflux transporter, RND family, MFP subunit n=1 Tax=Acetonema longum DSM 6540 TaxID=1009370 RepID=F7NLT6_9FIRM|nr:efflux RND transporter periplasmic adaptor subunit [Acetonema longum]EGO63027.1 efflux transporter, RND family, MFP subunit [Acetonema longum DSM 6540]